MAAPSYIIGIDLGTTNCAVAFANPGQGADAVVGDFAIPQLQRPGEVAALPLLPSSLTGGRVVVSDWMASPLGPVIV